MSEAPFDEARAHRWFAVEFNNAGWDLVEGGLRTPEQTERMLHFAHGALLHWEYAGKQINRQRALKLLAHAYASAGQYVPALEYARMAYALLEQPTDGETPFDRAATLGCLARTTHLAGLAPEADTWRAQALAAGAALDADDRAVCDKLLNLP